MLNINNGISIYACGQAPAELLPNDLLKIALKPLLGLPGYAALACASKTLQKKVQPILDAEWNRVMETITFGRDKWLNIPGVETVSDEPSLNQEQLKYIKAKFFKETCQIFNAPDPIQPHRFQNDKVKKTYETHMLVFFPKLINNTPRTLNTIGRLFRFEREGDSPTVIKCIPGSEDVPYRNKSSSESYWRIVPRDIFPGSSQASHRKMLDIVKIKGYVIPSPIDAVTAILIMNLGHLFRSGDYYFGSWTYTITDDEYRGVRLLAGGGGYYGIDVLCRNDESRIIGVAGFAKVPLGD